MISTDLNAEFCNTLYAWHALEERLKGNTIVDFNLMEWRGDGRHYQHRGKVLEDLDALLSEGETQTDRYFFQRIYGLRAYLIDVQNNQETDFDEYLEATMGVKLYPLPEDEIQDLQDKLKETLGELNINFENALEELAEKTKIIPVDTIPKWFDDQYEGSLKKAEQTFGIKPNIPKPLVHIFKENSQKRAYISAQGIQFSVGFNKTLTKGDSEKKLLGTYNHEILGHGINAVTLVEAIKKGDIALHNSLTTMQGVEAFQMEGLAESASKYFGDPNDMLYQASIALDYYGRQVTNNFLYLISRQNPDIDSAIAYHKEMLPYRDDNFIQKRFEITQGKNSLQRAYYPIYPSAMRLYCHAMDNLDSNAKKEFMQKTYTQLMDATDLYQLALKMGVPKLNHFKPSRPDAVNAVEQKISQPHP